MLPGGPASLIFAALFGGKTVDVRGGVETTTYYVPAIITLAVISATMQTLAMSVVIAREDGRLKRGARHADAAPGSSSPAGSATRSSSPC